MKTKQRSKNILLIDDNLSCANKIKKSIDLLGYRITVSNDPELAMEALARGKFDLVITGCELPGVSFREIITRIRARSAEMPVFVISENPDQQLRDSSFGWGASDFFFMHFEFDRLLLQIYKLP